MTRPVRSPALAMAAFVLILSAGLGGCGTAMVDQLPAAVGGEPAGIPQRPKTAYQYPAVHDMPPVRAATPLDDNQQIRMEKELEAVRDRQQSLYGTAEQTAASPSAETPPPVMSAPAGKPAPAAKKKGQ